MIYSMTGFGKAIFDIPNKKTTIEIRSLNNKQLDIYCKMPTSYRDKEFEIRSIISEMLGRGKVDFSIKEEILHSELRRKINKDIVLDYYNQIKIIQSELSEDINALAISLKMPDSLDTIEESIKDEEFIGFKNKLLEAVRMLVDFRKQEGAALSLDLTKRINSIIALLKDIEKYESQRITTIRDRLNKAFEDFFANQKLDKDRFEQEIIFYLEKLDITEEKVRLTNHCKYFLEVMQEKDNALGRKLGFIAQEIGREINTIGSKANCLEIQKDVVLMKDELEKIKEQLLNIL